MASLYILSWTEVEPRSSAIVLCLLVSFLFCSLVAAALVFTSYRMANVGDLHLVIVDGSTNSQDADTICSPAEPSSFSYTQRLFLGLIPAVRVCCGRTQFDK
jgi:hypothetical protein